MFLLCKEGTEEIPNKNIPRGNTPWDIFVESSFLARKEPSLIGGPSSDDPRPIRQSSGLSSYGLFKFFVCVAWPRRQKPTQSVGTKIYSREQRPFSTVESFVHNKKSAPTRGAHFLLVGHPLMTRALSDSPADCRLTGCSSFLSAWHGRAGKNQRKALVPKYTAANSGHSQR